MAASGKKLILYTTSVPTTHERFLSFEKCIFNLYNLFPSFEVYLVDGGSLDAVPRLCVLQQRAEPAFGKRFRGGYVCGAKKKTGSMDRGLKSGGKKLRGP